MRDCSPSDGLKTGDPVETERNQYQMVQGWRFDPSCVLFSLFLKNQPPSCSITRLSIDGLSLCNDELRVWEQGRCTNRAELLLNGCLVPGGSDICFWLLMWRKIKQVRSSCWLKTKLLLSCPHVPLPGVWNAAELQCPELCVPGDQAVKTESFDVGFSHVDECDGMFPSGTWKHRQVLLSHVE